MDGDEKLEIPAYWQGWLAKQQDDERVNAGIPMEVCVCPEREEAICPS